MCEHTYTMLHHHIQHTCMCTHAYIHNTRACMYMHVHLCAYMWMCVEDITNTFDCLTNNIVYAVTLW